MNVRTISIAITIILLMGCSSKHQKSESNDNNPSDNNDEHLENKTPTMVRPTGDPENDWIFVEQAVDAWLYFNISDFKSYEPLIRSTDYDSTRNIYTHHLHYRTMNEQGGMVTLERDFEVDLNHPGDNGNPFSVKEI